MILTASSAEAAKRGTLLVCLADDLVVDDGYDVFITLTLLISGAD